MRHASRYVLIETAIVAELGGVSSRLHASSVGLAEVGYAGKRFTAEGAENAELRIGFRPRSVALRRQ